MKSKLQKQEKGFTIIEVLIVLAIAGLIILIVFLAVPALQRNSRNTQRKNQASTYMSAVNEFINNRNGQPPTTATIGQLNALSADGTMAEPTGITAGAQTTPLAMDTMQLQTAVVCDNVNIGNTTATGANNRSVALRYTIEGNNGAVVMQCVNA